MSHHDCAPDEAAATIRRLLEARSARSRTGLAEMRQALEAATRAFEQAAAAAPDDDEIAAFVDRLAATAADDIDRANTQIEVTAADNARLGAALDEARARLQAHERTQQSLEQELAASVIRAGELEQELAASIAGVEDLRKAAADTATLTLTLDDTRQQLAAREQERAALATELAAAAAHIKALEHAVSDHASLTAAMDDVREQLTESQRDRERLARELAASAEQLQQLEAAHAAQAALSVTIEELRQQLQASEEQRTILASDLAAASAEIELLEAAGADQAIVSAALDDLRVQLHAGEEQRTILAGDLATATAEIERLEAAVNDQASLSAALEHAEHQLQASEGRRESLAGDLATCSARIRTLEGSLEDSRVFVDQLPVIFRSVSSARTIPDALTAVANGLTCYFPRVAIFRVRTTRLEAVYQEGFDFAGDLSSVVVPLTGDSPLTDAVAAERVAVLAPADLAGVSIPFGGSPNCALIVPITIEQKTVAVVYADDASRPAETVDPDERSAFAQLIREYATAHIDRIVTSQRMLAELDAYARLLLDEVEQLYQTDLASGRPAAQVLARLRENLQTARQIYAQRIELEPPAAAMLLEDRIQKVTRDAPSTPFGRDLLAITSGESAGARTAATPAAQAS